MRRRIPILAVLITTAALAMLGPVASAGASDLSIVKTVVGGITKVSRSQARLERSFAAFETNHQRGPLIRATQAEDGVILGFGNKLNRQAPSTPIGAAGKGHILAGLALILRSNRTVLSVLEGQRALTRAQLGRAVGSAKRGNAEIRTGINILKQLA